MANVRKIPNQITANNGQSFRVVQKQSDRGLGYFNPKTLEIVIHEDQPEFGKWIILMHEMIHLICEGLKQHGTIKREPSHKTITYLAGSLVPMMAHSGMLRGVNGEHEQEFFNSSVSGE